MFRNTRCFEYTSVWKHPEVGVFRKHELLRHARSSGRQGSTNNVVYGNAENIILQTDMVACKTFI